MKTTLWCKLTVATAGEGEGLTSPILSHPVRTWVSLMSRGPLLDNSDTESGIHEMGEVEDAEVAHLPSSGRVAISWNSVQLELSYRNEQNFPFSHLIFPSSSLSAPANISLISASDTCNTRFNYPYCPPIL